MKALRDRHEGFTLLELLMVVIIIAILASIALPQYFRVVERARTTQVMTLLSSIRMSELRFKASSPTNVYDNSGGLINIDIAPLPVMVDWGVPTLSGTGPGSNVRAARSAGVHALKTLEIDLDLGKVCAPIAAAAADWGVAAGAC